MYLLPLTPPDRKFAKADTERHEELLKRGGGSSDPLWDVIWGLTRLILSLLALPVRLSISWWLKQRRKRRRQGSPDV